MRFSRSSGRTYIQRSCGHWEFVQINERGKLREKLKKEASKIVCTLCFSAGLPSDSEAIKGDSE
jgi:hypothetical protein